MAKCFPYVGISLMDKSAKNTLVILAAVGLIASLIGYRRAFDSGENVLLAFAGLAGSLVGLSGALE